jgi:copper chaperone CopZ
MDALNPFAIGVIMNYREIRMAEFTLRIDGMHCGSCVRRVSQALSSAQGLTVKEVRIGAARVESKEQASAVDQAVAALARAGFTAHPEIETGF